MTASMSKVLITGGSGRLGRHVCDELSSANEITVFDRVAPAEGIPTILGDVTDLAALECAARGRDAIIHLAAIPSPRHGSLQEIFTTNTVGTWNVLQAARSGGVKRVIICSTDFVTGLPHQPASASPLYLPIDEDHPLRPAEVYGLSKQLAETIGHSFALCGIEVVILRLALVVFPQTQLAAMKAAEDISDPDLWWHVEAVDAARAFRLALERPVAGTDTFFIGSASTLSSMPTLVLVERRYGRLPEIRDRELYRRNPYAALFDVRHARDVLGFTPAERRHTEPHGRTHQPAPAGDSSETVK